MKVLSVVVPCYNSQDYMRCCIDSLLPGGNDVEILVVNDGSIDKTGGIADEYQKLYPGMVKVFHQENGGHGAAVTAGIRHSTGTFIKVVDSDDWVEANAYKKVVDTLRQFAGSVQPDMVVSNFVYEKQDKKHKKAVRYINALPRDRVFGWNETKRFRKGQYLLMHSIIYRTNVLRESGLELPRHTFYVDNLYAYLPLKDVKTIFYLDVDLYRYRTGHEGQSVHEETMIKNIDQQLLVNRMMITLLDLSGVHNKRQFNYLFHYLEIVTMVSSILLIRSGTRENLQKEKQLWDFIRTHNRRLYNKLRYGLLGQIVNLPGIIGRDISISVYEFSQRFFGFN
ncbi:MAG: glycosyltransferase family 2 protein [Treponema sp.]|nr:glycosyltransferase family 2 protein [Treponema sp.]